MLEYILSPHRLITSKISGGDQGVATYPSEGIVSYQISYWRNSRDAKLHKGVKPLAVRYEEYYDYDDEYDDDGYYETEWYVLGSDSNEYSFTFDRHEYSWGKGRRVGNLALYLKK